MKLEAYQNCVLRIVFEIPSVVIKSAIENFIRPVGSRYEMGFACAYRYLCNDKGSFESPSKSSIVQNRPVCVFWYLARRKYRPRSGSSCSPVKRKLLCVV